jgi:hypothetical protein
VTPPTYENAPTRVGPGGRPITLTVVSSNADAATISISEKLAGMAREKLRLAA